MNKKFCFLVAHSLIWEKGYTSMHYSFMPYMFIEHLNRVSSVRGALVWRQKRGPWDPGRLPRAAAVWAGFSRGILYYGEWDSRQRKPCLQMDGCLHETGILLEHRIYMGGKWEKLKNRQLLWSSAHQCWEHLAGWFILWSTFWFECNFLGIFLKGARRIGSYNYRFMLAKILNSRH